MNGYANFDFARAQTSSVQCYFPEISTEEAMLSCVKLCNDRNKYSLVS